MSALPRRSSAKASIPRKRRPVGLGRILRVVVPVLVLITGLALLAISWWGPLAPFSGATQISYDQFERDLKDHKLSSATLDGNIVRAHYRDDKSIVALTPDSSRTVELMLKNEVKVEAARAVPATGLSLPILCVALLPYFVLAYFAIALVRAVTDSTEFGEAERSVGEDSPLIAETSQENGDLSYGFHSTP